MAQKNHRIIENIQTDLQVREVKQELLGECVRRRQRHQMPMSSNAFISYHLAIGAGNIKAEQLGKQKRKGKEGKKKNQKKRNPKGKSEVGILNRKSMASGWAEDNRVLC